MKQFKAIVIKEFRHILRDYRTLMVLFGMPLAQVILFGFAITTEIHDSHIAILDNSKSIESRRFIDKIIASGYFETKDEPKNIEDINKLFKKGSIKLAIVFPSTFQNDMKHKNADIQLIADASEPNVATTLVNYAKAIIISEISKNYSFPYKINTHVTAHYNPLQKSVYLFVPGVITIILMLISAMLSAIALTREKEMGNMEILLVSPLKPAVIILGKVLPYLFLSITNAYIILFIGHLVFGVPIIGSQLLLFFESLLFVTCALSLGVFLSTVSTSQQMALMLSLMVLMLPTILLSGFIFPITSMPIPMQWLSAIIPAKYYIVILKNIMLKGADFYSVWRETLVLCGMTVFFILLSVKKFKTRLE